MQSIPARLALLFKQWSGHDPETFVALPPSGSPRRYFRMKCGKMSAIGAWNPSIGENEAFFYLTNHFRSLGLHVPELFSIDDDRQSYLLEDLGEVSLFSLVEKASGDHITGGIRDLYRKSLSELVRFQVIASKDLDFSYCYPNPGFDSRTMIWDLNYFKYCFLKLHLSFDENRLEDDFESLVSFLRQADAGYFMYRDFQSRNILIKNNLAYFIDYQGGKKGPLQYDLASLLFQVKADLPFDLREDLLNYYIRKISGEVVFDAEDFRKYYYGFVLLRLLQVLGAYGYRGLMEKKAHFISSIPFALKNLRWWLSNVKLPVGMPELINCLEGLSQLERYSAGTDQPGPKNLTVLISSFSYRSGWPEDYSGNGGGFVFDCRALPNPGREERYRAFNGKDPVIRDFLGKEPAVADFLDHAEQLVMQSVENYLQRGFTRLIVNFGCTGGQHRSVYCAENLADKLKVKFPGINIMVEHKMLDQWTNGTMKQ